MLPQKILLITRMKSQNAGNEALSAELINLIEDLNPKAEFRVMDRYPRFLQQFTIASLRRYARKNKGSDSLIDGFEYLSQTIINKYSGKSEGLEKIASANDAFVDLHIAHKPSLVKSIKRKIGIRKNLCKFGFIEKENLPICINTISNWADQIIWNPAGEIHPTGDNNEVMRLLLLMRIAQLSGKKTAIVNHSLEVSDQDLEELIRYVYGNSTGVIYRDSPSCNESARIAIPEKIIKESSDVVFIASKSNDIIMPPPQEKFLSGTICLAINGLEAYNGHDSWDWLFDNLKSLNRPIAFLSNAMNHDIKFAQKYSDKYEINIVNRQPNYKEIQGFYKNIDLLISSRLHSSILALCQSVPVVTIEPSMFKLTAIFDQLDYPIKTVNLNEKNWSEKVLENVNTALDNREKIGDIGHKLAISKANSVYEDYDSLFNQLRISD